MKQKAWLRHRGPKDGHFFQIHEWFMKTPAWKHATVYERSLYLELKRRYNGRNNGGIPLSHREARALLNCSNTAVEKAFKGLISKGFIRPQRRGSFGWKTDEQVDGAGRATRWRLTELPQDIPERVLTGGTKEFIRWNPADEKNAARSERTNGPFSADHSENMARSGRTINAGVSARGGR